MFAAVVDFVAAAAVVVVAVAAAVVDFVVVAAVVAAGVHFEAESLERGCLPMKNLFPEICSVFVVSPASSPHQLSPINHFKIMQARQTLLLTPTQHR